MSNPVGPPAQGRRRRGPGTDVAQVGLSPRSRRWVTNESEAFMEGENQRRWTVAEVAWDIGDDGDEDETYLYDDTESDDTASEVGADDDAAATTEHPVGVR